MLFFLTRVRCKLNVQCPTIKILQIYKQLHVLQVLYCPITAVYWNVNSLYIFVAEITKKINWKQVLICRIHNKYTTRFSEGKHSTVGKVVQKVLGSIPIEKNTRIDHICNWPFSRPCGRHDPSIPGGVGHWVFVTEIRILRLRLNTQANGEKSLRTRILLKLPHQFLENYRLNRYKFWNTDTKRYFEKLFPTHLKGTMEKLWEKAFESSIFPRFGGFCFSTQTVSGYFVSVPLRCWVDGVATCIET